jgi:hypothetical protein
LFVLLQVLSGFLAGAAALTLATPAQALTPVDLIDDRKVKTTGFDLIYEARELDLPQNVRDGMTQARQSLDETKKRVKASEARIDASLEPVIKKSYWWVMGVMGVGSDMTMQHACHAHASCHAGCLYAAHIPS